MNAVVVLTGLALEVSVAAARRVLKLISPSAPDWRPLVTDPTARRFVEHMLASFGAELHVKGDDLAMAAVAEVFDVGRLFGLALPSGKEFSRRFATTIGREIFVPSEILSGDPAALFEIVTHESQHVAQFNRLGFAMPWLYASQGEARAAYEANAYGAGLSVRHATTGGLPATDADLAPSLVTSYHLDEGDVSLAVDMLRSLASSADSGIVTTEAARVALDWLRTEAPQWVRPA